MTDEQSISRRRLLATGVGGSMLGLAGCVTAGIADGGDEDAVGEDEGADEDEQTTAGLPTFVDNGSDDAGENVVVSVTVLDEHGAPTEGVAVELEDRGGTPDDRYGRTGVDGTVVFVESVGPPPCNRQTVRLPNEGRSADLGCNDGGAELSATFTVTE